MGRCRTVGVQYSMVCKMGQYTFEVKQLIHYIDDDNDNDDIDDDIDDDIADNIDISNYLQQLLNQHPSP